MTGLATAARDAAAMPPTAAAFPFRPVPCAPDLRPSARQFWASLAHGPAAAGSLVTCPDDDKAKPVVPFKSGERGQDRIRHQNEARAAPCHVAGRSSVMIRLPGPHHSPACRHSRQRSGACKHGSRPGLSARNDSMNLPCRCVTNTDLPSEPPKVRLVGSVPRSEISRTSADSAG